MKQIKFWHRCIVHKEVVFAAFGVVVATVQKVHEYAGCSGVWWSALLSR